MAGMARPSIEFIQLDERNALLFNRANTDYILDMVRRATAEPARRAELYGEMARRFHIDPDKMNAAVIQYVDRLARQRRRNAATGARKEDRDHEAPEDKMDERVLLAELCRQAGHRYVAITLSQRRGLKECERCGKRQSRYNI